MAWPRAWVMAEGPSDPDGLGSAPLSQADDPDPILAIARLALERGDYGLVIRQLDPLCERESGRSRLGGEVRMLMATALLGQGQAERAAGLCRQLRACADPELRRQARDLEEVLQAPGLERPKEWSLTLPSLGRFESTPSTLPALAARRRRRRRADVEEPPPPPVGRTRAPIGFALAVSLVLVLLATLLGGCIRIDTELAFPSPGRLQISEQLSSRSGQLLPWQQQLQERLSGSPLRQAPAQGATPAGSVSLRSPVLPAKEALALISTSLEAASAVADLPLPPPRISWQEQNWLIGVQQHLDLELDLGALQTLPGLELRLTLRATSAGAIRQAQPLPISQADDGVVWPLQPGALNHLELRSWRWSRLGLGAVAVGLLLPGALLLQRQRRQAGFGWPELPS